MREESVMMQDKASKPGVDRISYSVSVPADGVALYSWKLDIETHPRMSHKVNGRGSHGSNIPDLKRFSPQFKK